MSRIRCGASLQARRGRRVQNEGTAKMSTVLLADPAADPQSGGLAPNLAAEPLFASLYSELHRLARRELSRRGGHMTLGATTLLHEVYLDMSARAGTVFPDHGRFLAYAARAMRGVIIDYARRRYSQKRGGEFELVSLQTTIADGLA